MEEIIELLENCLVVIIAWIVGYIIGNSGGPDGRA